MLHLMERGRRIDAVGSVALKVSACTGLLALLLFIASLLLPSYLVQGLPIQLPETSLLVFGLTFWLVLAGIGLRTAGSFVRGFASRRVRFSAPLHERLKTEQPLS